MAADFALERHIAFFKAHAESLAGAYKTMDTNRLTLLYFSVAGLDHLGALDKIDRQRAIRYIYSQQSSLPDHGGFFGYPKVAFETEELDRLNNQPHIANTYTALVTLVILGDDLKAVRRESIAQSLGKWQLADGSFCCVHGVSNTDSEHDMRFVYCAAAICYMLDLWHAVDVDRIVKYIVASRSYDSAIGMGPYCESHGGCTYCALAALSMMGRIHQLPHVERTVDWCAKRQSQGLQGRIEKPPDSCYSFWVGGSLNLLGAEAFLDTRSCVEFLTTCEDFRGGFKKFPESSHPDLLHSYFSVCGLCLCGLLPPLNCQLGISARAFSSIAGKVRIAPGGKVWNGPWSSQQGSTATVSKRAPMPASAAIGFALPVVLAMLYYYISRTTA